MNTQNLFISEAKLKARSLISENVDMKILRPVIFMVQDRYLHPILGTALLRDLDDMIGENSGALTSSAYVTLMNEFIHPCLIWYVQGEMQKFNTVKIAGKGSITKNSDNQQPLSMSELLHLEKLYLDQGEYYAQRLTNYLKARTDTFSKYLNQTGEESDAIYPNETSYSTGMYLGDEDCNDCDEGWKQRE